MVRKHVRRLIAFALATVVTATSITPGSLQNVYAATNVDAGNPFGGQNVALGKSVTVTAPEVAEYQNGYSVRELTDGDTTGNWESSKNYPQDTVVYEYPMNIDIDLQGSYLLDHIKVYWQDIIAPGAYEVQISSNKSDWTTIGEESEKVTGVESKSYTFDPQWAGYVRLACTKTSAYNCYGIREIEAYTIGGLKADSAEKENLALNNGETNFPQAVVYKEQASDASEFAASHLNDGDEGTRWATGESTTDGNGAYITEDMAPWCYIDLGEEKTFNEIRLLWEGAYASSYTIAAATDSAAVSEENIRTEGEQSLWTTIGTFTNTATGWQTQTIEDTTARYVRILAKTLQLEQYGMSIYEMEVNYCPPVSAEKIYLSQENEIIFDAVGDTVKLYAQALPKNAPNANEITWTTSNPDVATVTDGLVTAIGNGTATITASTSNGVEASINVMLLDKLETPTITAQKADDENQIDVSWTEISGATYEIYRIVDGVQESDAITVDTNSYTDKNVVAGSKYAYKVRAVRKEGETYSAIGDWSAESVAITIALAVDGVTLDKEAAELTIETGKASPTLNLKATVTPDKATNKNVTWNSDNEEAATVDASGKVTAVAAGKATITVTTEENGKTASCTVTVKEQLAAPAVTAEKTGAQEITLTWQTVENADTYQIYRAAGKNGTFEAVTVNKEDITVTDGMASYTDTIDENEIGNVYSYKVTAVPAGESYYIQSNESAETALVQIGKSNPFGMNVAEGKEAEVSSIGIGNADLIMNGVSDDLGEFWESAGNPNVPDAPDNLGTVDEYVTIDLKDVYDIDRVKIYWRPATPASIYTISVAGEDGDYKVIQSYDTRAADDLTDCIFDQVSEAVRYVKVDMTQAQSYGKCGIREIEVYTQGTVEADDAALSGILISQANEVLKKGEKLDLYAQVLPANAEAVVTWTSDSEAVTVAGGKVTAVSAGVATITATAGEFSKTCTVIVTDKLAAPTDVTAELEETEEKSVNVSWTASSDATAYDIYRTVDGLASCIAEDVEGTTFTDETVEAGKTYSYQIVAVNPALVEEDAIALYEDSDKSESSNAVTIPIHVTEVTLNKSEAKLTILPDEDMPTVTLTAVIAPSEATEKNVSWKSSDENVATVTDEGVVTAVAVGTVTITATTKDEKSTAFATCIITVTEKLAAPTVTAAITEDETAITVTVAGVEKADSYTLLKSINNGAYEEVSEAALTDETLTYADEEIAAGNSYSYKVKAVSNTPEVYLTSEESAATDEVVVPVHVTAVGLNKEEATLTILPGKEAPTVELTAIITPENATTKDVTWTSDHTDVADVDENGVVTAKTIGTAVITAATKDEKSTAAATCTITVVQKLDTPEVTAVKAEDDTSITVSWKLIDNADTYKLYRSVNEGEFEEVENAELTPAEGVITYVDTALEKGKTYSYKVTAVPVSESYIESEETTEGILIPIYVEKVTLDKETAELFVGGTLTLTETISPADATTKDVTWSSSDEKVAVVEKGIVTAKAVGTATITVTTKDGEKTASCVITVKDNLSAPVVSVSRNGADAIITWKQVANAVSYDVYASTDGKTYTKLGNTTALTYTEKSISLSMHYYKVVAKGSEYYVDSKDSNVVSLDNNVVKVTKVALNKTSVTLNKSKTVALAATVTPSNATNKVVNWNSSNMKVATVDKNGKVKAVGKGTATITATAADGSGVKATCKVTVKVPATKVTLNTKKIYVVKGKSVSLKATMTPSDTTDKITWKSNKPKTATVDKKGKIKAKKTGTVTITAKSTSGKKATCKVYVVSKATKSKSVKLNKKTATLKAGSTLTLKATMSPAKSTDTVKWSTSNKKLATVDAFGTVTAKKKGKVTITAKTTSGKKATCKITIK